MTSIAQIICDRFTDKENIRNLISKMPCICDLSKDPYFSSMEDEIIDVSECAIDHVYMDSAKFDRYFEIAIIININYSNIIEFVIISFYIDKISAKFSNLSIEIGNNNYGENASFSKYVHNKQYTGNEISESKLFNFYNISKLKSWINEHLECTIQSNCVEFDGSSTISLSPKHDSNWTNLFQMI